MGFILDKEQVKKGLIIFRRGDVVHNEFYCRVRIKNEDRYKTISLRTSVSCSADQEKPSASSSLDSSWK